MEQYAVCRMELTVKTAEKTDFILIKTNLVNEFIK